MKPEEIQEIVNNIQNRLEAIGVSFDKENFIKQSASLDLKKVEKSITLLVAIMEKEEDFSVKREAYRNLRHLEDRAVLICLADDLTAFKEIAEKGLPNFDLINYTLLATLVSSKTVADYLFKKDRLCDPKNNSDVISYAICSGDASWVNSLVQEWQIDVADRRYCIPFYLEKFSHPELADLSVASIQKSGKSLSSSLNSSAAFFSEVRVTKKQIPHFIAQSLEGILKEGWKGLDQLDATDKEAVLKVLNNRSLTPEQATLRAEEIFRKKSAPYEAIYLFEALFCARHIEKWSKIIHKSLKETMFDSPAKAYLDFFKISPTEENLKDIIHELKLEAFKIVSSFLKKDSKLLATVSQGEWKQ